jgi:hypothetical protein
MSLDHDSAGDYQSYPVIAPSYSSDSPSIQDISISPSPFKIYVKLPTREDRRLHYRSTNLYSHAYRVACRVQACSRPNRRWHTIMLTHCNVSRGRHDHGPFLPSSSSSDTPWNSAPLRAVYAQTTGNCEQITLRGYGNIYSWLSIGSSERTSRVYSTHGRWQCCNDSMGWWWCTNL